MIKQIQISKQDTGEFANLKHNPEDIQDDFYDYSKVVVKKPWGYEYLIFANETVAVWILYLKPGAQTSMHCHPNKKTSLVVLEGKVNCSTLAEKMERLAGDGLLLDQGVFHQTSSDSETGAFVMEIETPVNKRDLVRLKDKYGREKMGYEKEDQHSLNTQNYNYITFSTNSLTHNLKKRFGQCSLTFKKVSNESDLNEIYKLEPVDVLCVLNGQLRDQSNQSVVRVGDTMTIAHLKEFGKLSIGQQTELLLIKKIDRIVKVSDFIADFLKKQNLSPVFVVPGEANVHLLDSIGRQEGLRYVCTQVEKSASFAVESFGKLKSDVGTLVVSSGGAATSVLPGVANAWVDSVPLLILSGQAKTDQDFGAVRQLGNKSLEITKLAHSITKYAVKVTDPTTIRYHLEKALYLAKNGRPGPVWIDLPIDVQGMTVDADELKVFNPAELEKEYPAPKPLKEKIVLLADYLKKSSRPVILAGSGIANAKAREDFLKLVDHLKIPVLTSRRGADLIPADHPSFFGHPGTYGQRSANFVVQNADLLISIGSRLSIPLIGRNTRAFARNAKKIIVDIDPNELEKPTVIPNLPIVADAGEFIRECLKNLPDNFPDYSAWIRRCHEWKEKFPPDSYTGPSLPFEAPAINGPIHPLPLLKTLSELLEENDVLVADGGPPLIYTLLAYRFKKGQRLISSTGLELPGFALAGSIGASFVEGYKRVICLCEDRGFQIGLQELQTIVAYHLPIKILILKSQGHSIIRNIQKDYFGGRFVATDHEIRLGTAPLIEIVKAHDIPTVEVAKQKELILTLKEWLKIKGPAVCEIQIENDQDKLPRPGFTIRDDQKWIAKPLEDMYPLLDRKTLKENMIIDLMEED